jgi:hypothetical protein
MSSNDINIGVFQLSVLMVLVVYLPVFILKLGHQLHASNLTMIILVIQQFKIE